MQTTTTLPPIDPIHGHFCCVKMTLAQQQRRQRRKLRQNKKSSYRLTKKFEPGSTFAPTKSSLKALHPKIQHSETHTYINMNKSRETILWYNEWMSNATISTAQDTVSLASATAGSGMLWWRQVSVQMWAQESSMSHFVDFIQTIKILPDIINCSAVLKCCAVLLKLSQVLVATRPHTHSTLHCFDAELFSVWTPT